MSRIKMILADSNTTHLHYLQKQWENELDFDINAIVTTGPALLKQIDRVKPDVVVMDLLLKDMDGFAVLQALKDMPYHPMMIVYSALLEEPILQRCSDFGVAYFIKKPTEAMYLAKRIRMLCYPKDQSAKPIYDGSAFDAKARVRVTQLLNRIGMPAKLSGYRYLRRALLMSMANQTVLEDLSTRLYAPVAQEEGTNATNVERSIRYAIEHVFMYGHLDAIHKLFGFTINSNKGKPSNREFIAMLTDRMMISERHAK